LRKHTMYEKRIEIMAKQVPGRNRFHDAWLMLIGSMIR
jgi:hypothetical protein